MERYFTESAQNDLLEAWQFIAEENPAAADRVLDVIDGEAQMLLHQPLMGKARPELAEGMRSWPTSTSYILFYVAAKESITVVRVLHRARDIQRIDF